MTGRGSRMSPEERFLRSVYLNYQVCTDVVRHYFDGLHPPTSLVQYLLDQRTKFEKEEKKIPNYQWIQLYPEVLFRADVHIKETYLASYDKTDRKDYKEFTDRISTIFTCLFDSVDGDQKVKVVNLSRFESGEVFATLEITSQYNSDDRIIQSALEVPVNSGNVDESLETRPDGFIFAKQGVLYRADVHIKETYLASYDKTDRKDYKEFTDRISTIFTCLFDSVDGDQKVKVVNLSRFESGEVLATLEITSQYNSDDRIIQSALEVPVNSGNVDTSLETSPDGFTFDKQGDTYRMEIKLTKVNAAALALKGTKEFRIMAKKLERILLLLFDTVPGTQSVEVVEFRCLTSDCATAICKLTSEKHKDDKRLEEAISIPTLEGRLGKTLKTICTPHRFSFKEVIVFEAEINVKEKFSKTLENSNSNDFKAFANRVQPILKGLYNSVTGDQDVEIVKCRQGSSDTVLVLYHLISHGNNDEEGLRAVTERKIQTGSLSLSYGITDDGFSFETNKCMFEVTLRLAEKYSDSKEIANPKSETFKSFKEKVQPQILRLYNAVYGSQEIDILRYKIESSGAVHSIIFKLTSSGCSDESTLKEPVEKQIQTGLLGSNLKVCATDLHFQKLTETVFYQVTLNVKKTFTDELKKKHSADYLAFSKFVQTVLRTQYEKVPGKQEFNVIECRQGPSGTNSTVVIIDVISKDCTNNVYMQLCQPVKNLITLGKLELALTTSFEDFSFRITRGSKPASSKSFDLSLLITLLRKDSNVKPPNNGYDFLPSKDSIRDGAQIATIKHYRNELAHASEAKMDEHEFDCLWSRLENAVRILGKDDKFMKAVDDASTRKLDSSTEEVLIRMVQHARQVLQLEEAVTELYQKIEKLTKQTEDQSASTKVEISEIKEEIGKKEGQILKIKTDMQTLHTELHRIEKKFDEKFRVQDERNVQQDEMNKDMGSGIQENRRGIEENRRDIQRIDAKNSSTNHSLVTTATEISSEDSNFIRIYFLIVKISSRAVRLTFDQEFHPCCLCKTLKRSILRLRRLQMKRIINMRQMALLFPPTGKPSSEDFDITLMICLIRNMTDIQIGMELPLPTQVSVGDDLTRIRYYRNKIAHTENFLNDAEFNIYWEDISQALHRLAGGLFDEEIIQLKHKVLQSPNSISQQNIHVQKQFVEVHKQFVEVHKQLGEATEKVKSLERLANDPIPKKKKDLFENKINDWLKNEEKFYETAATKKILGVVKENTFTVISGNSGMGKTITAHHIALHLQKHGDYQILPIFEPQDIVTYYVEELAQIFVIDDICGVFNVDQHLINSWDRVSSYIQSFFKENNHVRILVTCRLQIINSPQFKKLSDKLNMKECNLLSKDFAFTYNEKKNIAYNHMDKKHMRKLSKKIICSLDMFPFLCDSFGRSGKEDIKIFECPIQYFEEQFDQMRYNNEGCFLGLALLVICNDTIKTNVFKDESKGTGFKKIFNEVFESLKLSNRPSKMHVLEQLNTLIDSYITINIDNNESVITSKHDIIFDSLSLYFGKTITKTLVEYATPDFIASRIQFKSLDKEPNEYTIMIPQDLEHLYFNRMEEEILKKNFYAVFGNQQSHFRSYQEKFIDFFSEKKDILETLLHNRWSLYLSSMYGCSIFVQFLLEHTPSELLQDISDKSCFEIAAYDSDTEEVDTDSDRYKITHKNAPLVVACTEGHLEIVKILVKYGYDIDVVKEGMLSPLFAACYNGHKNIVQFLLAYDCKVDLEDHHCQTALHGACMKNNTDIVSLLLKKGFCINKESFRNTETPLFIACKHGYPEVVNILLKHNCGIDTCNKCDVHFINALRRTALHEACSADHTQALNEEDDTLSNEGEEDGIHLDDHKLDNRIHDKNETFRKRIVENLLHNNVNPCIADHDGYTALHMAAESGYTTIVDILLKKLLEMNKMGLVNEDIPVDLYKSVIPPLFASSTKSVVNVFVQHNCNINVLDSHGRNALHHASEKGYLEVVEYLYENGCKRDIFSATGRSVLHAACRGEKEETVEFNLKKGCYIDHADNKDETPLFVACEGSNLKVLNILIKYKCDVNKVSVGGNNVLQKVCVNGHAEIADILLKNKININQTNNSYKTPLFYACIHGNQDVVSLLMQNKCDVNIRNKEGHIALHLSCLLGNIQITQLLLQNHSDINQADNLKQTPLHLAAREGYSDVVKLLITNRCDMNACDINGRNALHVACKQEDENDDPYGLKGLLERIRQETCHKDVVALLLQSQCDANQRDNLGQMPLHLACEKSIYKYKKCIPDIVKLLLESGSDINKCDNSHRSPLLIACENGDRSEEIVKVLLDKNCDINIKDVNGQTALEICKSKGYTSIAGNLLNSQNPQMELLRKILEFITFFIRYISY